MIPDNQWSCITKPQLFVDRVLDRPTARFSGVFDIKPGPIRLSQSGGSLNDLMWMVSYESGNVLLRHALDANTWSAPVTLFAEPAGIQDISVSFDGLGRPLVFYARGTELVLWYYDSLVGDVVFRVIEADGITPIINYDMVEDTSDPAADVMLYYVRDDAIFTRLQRDRFDIEYATGVQFPGLRLERSGMTKDNRFQVVYTFRDLRDGALMHRKSLETESLIMRQLKGHALEVGFRIALAPSHCELRALTKRYGTNWNGFYTIVDHSGTHVPAGATFEEHLFTLQFMFVDVDDDTNQDIIVRLSRTSFDGGDYFVFQTDAITFNSGNYVLRFTQAAPDNGVDMKRIELIKNGVTIIDRTEVDGESPYGDALPSVRNRLRFGAACEMNVSGSTAGGSDVTVYKHLFPAVFTNIYTIADGIRTDWPKAYSDQFTQSAPAGNPLTLYRDGDDSYIFKGGSGAVDIAGVAPYVIAMPFITQTNELVLTYRLDPGWFGGDIPMIKTSRWRVNGVDSPVQGLEFVVGTDYPGDSIDCVVTASNQAGTLDITTNNIIVNFGQSPFMLSAPSIYGTPSIGGVMHLVQGDYGGDVPMTINVQWRRNEVDIAGATSSPYTVTEDDVGQSLDCKITVTNATGSIVVYTNNQIMGYGAPIIINNPSIGGQVVVGATLSVTPGTYNGNAPMTVTRNWQRNGANIAGATGTTYVVQTDDLGTSITCLETISNPLGTVTASSNVLRVSGLAPYTITAPTIAGNKAIGGTLTLTAGSYGGQQPLNINRQWLRNGAAIAGEIGATYVVQAQDDGKSISCAEYISNDVGTIGVNTNVILIGVTPLFVIMHPKLLGWGPAGTTETGKPISIFQNAIFGGDGPATFVKQWMRNGVVIVGETGDTYLVRDSDAGADITLTVTGTNSVSTVTATSDALTVMGLAPYVITAPTISGSAVVNSSLAAASFVFGGETPQTITYQWYRGTSPISNATGQTYLLGQVDVGTVVSVRVTATNSRGSATGVSAGLTVTDVATPPPGSDIAPGLGIADTADFVVNDTRNPVTSTATVIFRPDGSTSYSTLNGVANGRFITEANGADYVISYAVVYGPDLNGWPPNILAPLSSMFVVNQIATSRYDYVRTGRYSFTVALANDPSVSATTDITITAETYSSYLANNG
jgi:hypothetical protein